jgi:hypothetical protein
MEAVPIGLPALTALAREQFEEGNFVRPASLANRLQPGIPWPAVILTRLVGLVSGEADRMLEIRPWLPAPSEGGWNYFCVENLPFRGRLLTLVWDDPAHPEDAFHDGDKGFTIYVDGVRIAHSERLASFQIDSPPV